MAVCRECGVDWGSGSNTSHCRGGAYGGCCRTFSSTSAFDLHRTGPWDARVCLDPAGLRIQNGAREGDPRLILLDRPYECWGEYQPRPHPHSERRNLSASTASSGTSAYLDDMVL